MGVNTTAAWFTKRGFNSFGTIMSELKTERIAFHPCPCIGGDVVAPHIVQRPGKAFAAKEPQVAVVIRPGGSSFLAAAWVISCVRNAHRATMTGIVTSCTGAFHPR